VFELIDQRQNAAVRELLAPDFRMVMGGNPPIDVEAWLGMGEMFYAAFPDGRHTIEEAYDIGSDRAVLRAAFSGTHTNDFMGIPPTGRSVRITFLNLDRFADGKLAEHHAQVDMFGLMQQLGVAPT
jgi:predicted ester cyclase